MNVTQLINSNGNAVKNQFVITTSKGQYFKSYDSLIGFVTKEGSIILTEKWNYSQTTVKHLKTFLGCSLTKSQLQKRIDQGGIELKNDLEIV